MNQNENDIYFKIGDDKVVYSTDINAFEENSGLTIKNVNLKTLKGYYIPLSDIGGSTVLSCGNIVENLATQIKIEKDNILLIIDFKNIEEVSESFLNSYTKFLLETSNKVITINMSTIISNDFSNFIINTIDNVEEEEE